MTIPSTDETVLVLGPLYPGCHWLQVRTKLPALLKAVQDSGQVVTWVCDPMHGNTESCNGFKTRRYDNIRSEVPLPLIPVLQMPASCTTCQAPEQLRLPWCSLMTQAGLKLSDLSATLMGQHCVRRHRWLTALSLDTSRLVLPAALD